MFFRTYFIPNILLLTAFLLAVTAGCTAADPAASAQEPTRAKAAEAPAEVPDAATPAEPDGARVTTGSETYRGFVLDNVLHSDTDGDIHYHLYVPDHYNGSTPFALFVTLPGYEGLYFQGVGVNLEQESFAFEAQSYSSDMIIAAPQLNDWGETSASQTIALIEYLLEAYRIDPDRVYAEGYSGGGETLSLVLGRRPELFAACLLGSTRWDGDYAPVADSRTPVYLAVGAGDEYYGAAPLQEAYDTLHALYAEQGLTEEEIDTLLVLDIREASYFQARGFSNQHAGGQTFAQDAQIMGWLFQAESGR